MQNTQGHAAKPKVAYDVQRMAEDMALRGWLNTDLARAADVSDMTVTRFLRAEHQTAKTADRLARALGYTIRRYLVRNVEAVAS
jgi:plasmid maintenance system antidote protein VapI